MILQHAQATADSEILYISPHASNHELDIPAHEVTLSVQLSADQVELATELLRGKGKIEGLVRSAIAQLGIDLEVQNVKINQSKLELSGLLLVMPNSPGERVMETIISLSESISLQIGRAALLPDEARLTKDQVESEISTGSIISNNVTVDVVGKLLLPLTDDRHVFVDEHPSRDALMDVLKGQKSGRSIIAGMRTIHMRHPFLNSRDFLVGGIDLHSVHSHIVLEPWAIKSDGEVSHAMHLSAYLLDAGRTQGGHRHVELWNANGAPVDLSTVQITAHAYKAKDILAPGA